MRCNGDSCIRLKHDSDAQQRPRHPDLQTPKTGLLAIIRANETGLLPPDLLGKEITRFMLAGWSPHNAGPLEPKVDSHPCRWSPLPATYELPFEWLSSWPTGARRPAPGTLNYSEYGFGRSRSGLLINAVSICIDTGDTVLRR